MCLRSKHLKYIAKMHVFGEVIYVTVIFLWHLLKHKLNIFTCGGSNCSCISSFGGKGRAVVVIQPVNGREIRVPVGVLIFNLNVFLTFTTTSSFQFYGQSKQICNVTEFGNHQNVVSHFISNLMS